MPTNSFYAANNAPISGLIYGLNGTSNTAIAVNVDANGSFVMSGGGSSVTLANNVVVLGASANTIGAVNLDIGGAALSASNPVFMADAYQAPSVITWTSATAANTVLAVSTAGYGGLLVSLVVTGTITAGNVIFEAYDGAMWLPTKVYPLDSYNSYTSVNLATGLSTGFQADIAGCTQFRVRLGTAITGAGSLILTELVTAAPLVPAVTVGLDPSQPLPAGSNMIGGVKPDAVLDAVTVNGSQSAAAVVVSASTQGFTGGAFQVTSAGTTCTVSYEQCNDNASWVPMLVYSATSSGSISNTTTTGTGIFYYNSSAAYVRARVSTYTSGTVTIYLTQKRTSGQYIGQSLAAGGQTIGNVTLTSGAQVVGYAGIGYVASNANAASAASILSPAVPAAASIKGLAGRVVGVSLQNSASAIRSVKFYNATAVTMGTTAAAFEMDIPAGGTLNFMLEGGIGFATGIMWAVTGAKGLTDNTTTGLAANDVSGAVFYA